MYTRSLVITAAEDSGKMSESLFLSDKNIVTDRYLHRLAPVMSSESLTFSCDANF